MSTLFSTNDNSSSRDDFFEKLANDYWRNGTSSILAGFIEEDILKSVDRLKREIDPLKPLQLPDKAGAIPKFYYYYELFKNNSEDPHMVFICFSQILQTISSRFAPFFSEQKSDDLYQALSFVLHGFSADSCYAKSRTQLHKLLINFCKSLSSVQEKYEEEFTKHESIEMLDNLFSLLKCNVIHFKARTYFNDNGYQLARENEDYVVNRKTPDSFHPA